MLHNMVILLVLARKFRIIFLSFKNLSDKNSKMTHSVTSAYFSGDASIDRFFLSHGGEIFQHLGMTCFLRTQSWVWDWKGHLTLQMANRKVVIEEVLTERENYSKVILHKPMMLPKKDQKSEKEIDIRDSSRYRIPSIIIRTRLVFAFD